MKEWSFFCILLCFLTFQLCSSQNLQCGTVVTTSTGGVLQYKLNENYRTAEKCVWTIRAPSTSHFKFTKETSHFQGHDTYLTIHTFRNGGSIGNGVLGQNDDQQVLSLNGTVAVIVFTASKSENVLGKGFRLKFEVLGEPDPEVVAGRDYIVSAKNGSLTYPVPFSNGTQPSYSNNEVSTIVLSLGFMGNTHSEMTTRISIQFPEADIMPTYGGRCLEECSCDAVVLYQVVEKELLNIGRYCANGPSGQFEAEDLLIVVFISDADYVGSGFELYWEMY